MAGFTLQKECVIARAPDVVRAHFLDFQHHIRHEVHKGVRYEVLQHDDEGARQRVRSRFRVMGMPKVDEIRTYVTPSGDVVQDFERGDFAGGNLRVRVEEERPGVSHLYATFDVPLRGINRLIGGVVRRTVSKLADQAIEEDRLDLESGYTPPPGLLRAMASVMGKS